jgi:hypothetical protein
MWAYITKLLGPGPQWGKSKAELEKAIARADKENQPGAVAHLRIILQRRNAVYMEHDSPTKEQAK